jgi:hypothetical protein
MRVQLLGQEFVGQALVDQDAAGVRRARLRGHQRRGVVCGPGLRVGTQVAGESLVPPGALRGRADRRKGRQRLEHARVAQRQRQRAVPAHGVAEDADAPASTGSCAVTSGSSSFMSQLSMRQCVAQGACVASR